MNKYREFFQPERNVPILKIHQNKEFELIESIFNTLKALN